MAKRKFSTYELAKQFGFVAETTKEKEQLGPDFEYVNLEQFKFGVFYFKIPAQYSDLLVIKENLSRLHHELATVRSADAVKIELQNLRKSLMILFVSHSIYIAENFTVELNDGTTAVYRFDTEIFVAILHVSLLLIEEVMFEANCEDDFPYVVKNELTSGRSLTKPVMQFTIAEIVETLFLFGDEWHKLKFSREIPVYLELITCRLAQLYFLPNPKKESCGVGDLEEYFEDGTFGIQLKTVEDLGWTLREMFRKIYVHSYVCRNLQVQCPRFSKQDRETLYNKCIDADNNDDLQQPFMNFCFNYFVMPGERLAYLREKPNKDPRPDRLLKFRTGSSDRVNWISERLDEAMKTIIEKEYFGKAVNDIALLFLLDVYASNLLATSFSERFVVFYDWLNKAGDQLERQLAEKHYPLILQSFNWIGLYYSGMYYDHQNVLDAFLHWMKIVSGPPWNMRIDGLRMESFEMYRYEWYRDDLN